MRASLDGATFSRSDLSSWHWLAVGISVMAPNAPVHGQSATQAHQVSVVADATAAVAKLAKATQFRSRPGWLTTLPVCVTNVGTDQIELASQDDCAMASWRLSKGPFELLVQSCRKSSYRTIRLAPGQQHCLTLPLWRPAGERLDDVRLRVGFADARSSDRSDKRFSWSNAVRLP